MGNPAQRVLNCNVFLRERNFTATVSSVFAFKLYAPGHPLYRRLARGYAEIAGRLARGIRSNLTKGGGGVGALR